MITRIRELLDARQLSPTQFADLIGVGRPVISHILSERNKPSLEVVQKIIGAFPDISLPWLLAGTGPMLAAEVEPSVASPTSKETPQAPVVAPSPSVAAAPLSPTPAPFASSATLTRPTAALQPRHYPQPPRFRPGAPAAAIPARVEGPPIIEQPASSTDSTAAVSALPSLSSLPTPTVAAPASNPATVPTLAAPAQTIPLPAPATPAPPPMPNEDLGASSPIMPAAEAPSSPSSEASAASPNPAAALAFLGEPGKAIRRIVIFYRDGSFSDYLPEGS